MEKQNDQIIKLQEELTSCMKKEIGLMREVLANMHQEEVALIMFDKKSLTLTLQERFPLVQRLSSLRMYRLETTRHIEHLLCPQHTRKKLPIEQILPEHQQESCELIYLTEQIVALVEKMNMQNTKNESLMKNYEIFSNSPAQFHQGIHLHKEEAKKGKSKASVATYPHKET